MGIKKKILLGWLAFEAIGVLVAIPAGAQILDKVMFQVAPRAAAAQTQLAPGRTEILIASNAPFSIIATGMVGEMSVSLDVNGTINGKHFGANAQNPGDVPACVFAASDTPVNIYQAKRRTAANRGPVIEQAVKVVIDYDPSSTPEFAVVTLDQDSAKTASPALACAA